MTIRYLIEDNENDWKKLRTIVFVEEQGFQNEFDETDDIAMHFTFYVDDELAGCGRMFEDEENHDMVVFGRIAVLEKFRHQGLATYIIETMETIAKDAGYKIVYLSSQCNVQGLYENIGYDVCGEPQMDEHVQHIGMKKAL
ncbi:MAG: GNAT family N-acetyltransferase [Erysipelotrichaceae bacterium]